MVRELSVQRCLYRLLYWRVPRVLRQHLLVGLLFAFTLLVIMAWLEAEADNRLLEANTFVLEGGFPAVAVNGSVLRLLGVHFPPAPNGVTSYLTKPDHKMAAVVAAHRPKWILSHYKPELASNEHLPSCQRLIAGDKAENGRGKAFMENHQRVEKTPQDYLRETRNCSRFIQKRGYIMSASAEELAFPLAYSMMMYTGVEQAERLLRAIYRPHNFYCIHVDRKSPEEIMQAMRAIAGCLPNVFVASRLNKVYWATWSSLEALIFCMDDLWRASATWKYYINLTGQEFPLKTNLQLVRILTALNGSNIVDASTDPNRQWRWYNNFSPPPHGIVPYKGMVFMIACRRFIDYILHSQVAYDFLQWVRYTEMPDETYFPSLNHNPQLMVPGAYKGFPDTNALVKPYLARFVNWNTNWKDGYGRYNFRFPCFGKWVRNICIFGIGDLPALTSRKELFTNKLHADYEPLTLSCMEEWLLNMTVAEYSGKLRLNSTYYSSLDIVRNKVM